MKKATSGGSSPFKVTNAPVKIAPMTEPSEEELMEEQETLEGEYASSATDQLVADAMVETTAKMLGKLTVLITKIDEMDFDEEEIQQLKALWSPIMPTVSPVFGAIIGTSVIVLSKMATYKILKKGGKKNAEKSAKEQDDRVPEIPD